MCSLDPEKLIFISARNESNTQVDFLKFLVDAIDEKYLKRGDFVVCDNASIHGGEETLELLLEYLQVNEVTLIYLPAYSPELNPCELVFAMVKTFLRNNRNISIPLLEDIAIGFAIPTKENMENFYHKCCRSFEK